ncbi:hypothetical protein HDU96_003328 [Phlyctochytrium bullatum]|nr:hypothetical protein HDU96_003328 [Phlyctochytrium bullatum]
MDQTKNSVDESVFTWIKEPPRAVVSSSPATSRTGTTGGYNYVSDASGMGAGAPRTKASWATRKPAAASGVTDRNDVKTSSSTSAGSTPTAFTPMPTSEELRRNGPRVIVFVLGGVTYSEIRSCHEVLRESNREIFVDPPPLGWPAATVETSIPAPSRKYISADTTLGMTEATLSEVATAISRRWIILVDRRGKILRGVTEMMDMVTRVGALKGDIRKGPLPANTIRGEILAWIPERQILA